VLTFARTIVGRHPPFQVHWNFSGIFRNFYSLFLKIKIQSPGVGACVSNLDVGCLVWLTGLSYPYIVGSHRSLPPVGGGAVGQLDPLWIPHPGVFLSLWSPGIFNPFSLLPKECSREEGSWKQASLSTDLSLR